MKKATGNYVGVRAITKRQAVNLARKLFDGRINKLWAEGNKLWAEGNKLRAEGNKLRAEGNKLRAEGDKLRAECDKLRAEGDKLWVEIAIKHKGYIPDYRAINFIAKDLPDHVYCFAWNRKEIGTYDGKACPVWDDIEKVEWK